MRPGTWDICKGPDQEIQQGCCENKLRTPYIQGLMASIHAPRNTPSAEPKHQGSWLQLVTHGFAAVDGKEQPEPSSTGTP